MKIMERIERRMRNSKLPTEPILTLMYGWWIHVVIIYGFDR